MKLFELQDKAYPGRHPAEPSIALLPAGGAVWEDFLDPIGVSLEEFCSEGPGGWMLGYIDAFTFCGLRTVLIFFSARITSPVRYRHAASGTTIVGLPAPAAYRALRGKLDNMRKRTAERHGLLRRVMLRMIYQVAPHLSTPLQLLSRELRREGCQAIVCQEYEYFRFDMCVVLGKLMRVPVFATFQGVNREPNLISRVLRPLTIRGSTGLFIAPQIEIERVRRRYDLPSARVLQIFNPVDTKMWSAVDRDQARAAFDLPPGARVAVWHGRVEIESKGLDILLDAWQQVCQQP
jgi:glycosyltransferase involved in cell wall biosynthesis